jgi:hypothetical protein
MYGGDVTFARRINLALFDDKARGKIFKDITPLLARADLVLVNGEGVISSGGWFSDKGEPRPYMYRAHPRMIDVLVDAGIDLVTAGNNHSGDYGPDALREMLDRLGLAGIGYTGAGYNLADARTPYYKRIGDTVVAIVGVDLTYTKKYAATSKRPGTLYYPSNSKRQDQTVTRLERIVKKAREHAHVVLLTPHWGDNWKREPAKEIRELARRLIHAGFDGILGHSAHWFQGVEIIDGKPVIYDAGNLLLDFGGGDEAHRSMLWELDFSRAGVTKLSGHPLWHRENQATLAKGKMRDEILGALKDRSAKLGTSLRIEDGVAKIDCFPKRVEKPTSTTVPLRPVPSAIREAPPKTIIEELPKSATPINVVYDNGIRLVGFELMLKELSVPKAGQFVNLYWTTDKPVEQSYMVHLEAQQNEGPIGKIAKNYAIHLPGDWIVPTTEWPVGKIVRDSTLCRLTFKPQGEVKFYVGLSQKKIIKPSASNFPSLENGLVLLGSARYRKGAPTMFAAIADPND